TPDALDVALDPPAIEHRQAWHAVERRFHAARAGGLEWLHRIVEPEIDAGNHLRRDLHLVILDVHDLHCVRELHRRLVNAANELLAADVVRMRLPAEDDLDRTDRVGDLEEAVGIRDY